MRQTRAGELSMWKGAAAANASRNALAAALLAEAGMTGPFHPFDGEMGFVAQLLDGEPFDEAPFAGMEAGAPPSRILDTYIKYWPVDTTRRAPSTPSCAADRPRRTLEGRDIHIHTFGAAYQIIARTPEGPEDARDRRPLAAVHRGRRLEDGEVTQGTFDLEGSGGRRRHRPARGLIPEPVAGYPDGIPEPGRAPTARSPWRGPLPTRARKNPMTDDEVTAK
jgi:2-methylcitrate dehydratase